VSWPELELSFPVVLESLLLPPESVPVVSSFADVPVAHATRPANPAANIARTTRMETLARQFSPTGLERIRFSGLYGHEYGEQYAVTSLTHVESHETEQQ
jgi:hypothetical protein